MWNHSAGNVAQVVSHINEYTNHKSEQCILKFDGALVFEPTKVENYRQSESCGIILHKVKLCCFHMQLCLRIVEKHNKCQNSMESSFLMPKKLKLPSKRVLRKPSSKRRRSGLDWYMTSAVVISRKWTASINWIWRSYWQEKYWYRRVWYRTLWTYTLLLSFCRSFDCYSSRQTIFVCLYPKVNSKNDFQPPKRLDYTPRTNTCSFGGMIGD